MSTFTKRIYEDYFKRSRLNDYKRVLQKAYSCEYKMLGIKDFYYHVISDENDDLILVNRHDIDTSPRVAKKMFDIEKEVYGKQGSATYYFRKSTLDINLANEIEAYGYEAAFHYEEIADYVKENKITSKEQINIHMGNIATKFLNDLNTFRSITGSKSQTVASHGDWINVRFKMPNLEILRNSDIRKKSGILIEAYDDEMMKFVKERYADQVLLDKFSESVIDAIDRRCKIIMILTHPRNLEVDFFATTNENWKRLSEEIKYKYF